MRNYSLPDNLSTPFVDLREKTTQKWAESTSSITWFGSRVYARPRIFKDKKATEQEEWAAIVVSRFCANFFRDDAIITRAEFIRIFTGRYQRNKAYLSSAESKIMLERLLTRGILTEVYRDTYQLARAELFFCSDRIRAAKEKNREATRIRMAQKRLSTGLVKPSSRGADVKITGLSENVLDTFTNMESPSQSKVAEHAFPDPVNCQIPPSKATLKNKHDLGFTAPPDFGSIFSSTAGLVEPTPENLSKHTKRAEAPSPLSQGMRGQTTSGLSSAGSLLRDIVPKIQAPPDKPKAPFTSLVPQSESSFGVDAYASQSKAKPPEVPFDAADGSPLKADEQARLDRLGLGGLFGRMMAKQAQAKIKSPIPEPPPIPDELDTEALIAQDRRDNQKDRYARGSIAQTSPPKFEPPKPSGFIPNFNPKMHNHTQIAYERPIEPRDIQALAQATSHDFVRQGLQALVLRSIGKDVGYGHLKWVCAKGMPNFMRQRMAQSMPPEALARLMASQLMRCAKGELRDR